MRLKWERQPEHERQVAEMYAERGMPAASAPTVHYGYNALGREALHVLTSREQWAPGDERWHVSVSGQGRIPTWDELVESCHAMRPGVPFVVGIPPRSWWMNVHPHVLHAWETRDSELVNQWRANRRGHEPTAGELAAP